MKYWTGYLTAAVLGVITWALTKLAERFSTLVDMVYPYVTRTLQDTLAAWTASADYCLWQVIVMALVVIVIATLVLVIILRWNPVRWLGWVLAGASFLYMLHMLVFGLNYYAGSLADDIRMEVREYSVEELADAAEYYRDKANVLAMQVKRDADGDVEFSDFETLATQAGNGFDALVYDRSFPVFAGNTLPVKKLGWADMYTSMGITGVTMGVTGEAAVNPKIPAVSMPFTMCHEMAHRMCIATEGDANFAGFLAASHNESVEFQYSAYFMAYRYCYNALASSDSVSAAGAAARVSSGVNDKLKHDLTAYNEYFASKRNDTATKLANTANDTYLKASGDEDGLASYGAVTDLLVCWHYQEIVLPTIVVEESPFDPLDESQIDLSTTQVDVGATEEATDGQ